MSGEQKPRRPISLVSFRLSLVLGILSGIARLIGLSNLVGPPYSYGSRPAYVAGFVVTYTIRHFGAEATIVALASFAVLVPTIALVVWLWRWVSG